MGRWGDGKLEMTPLKPGSLASWHPQGSPQPHEYLEGECQMNPDLRFALQRLPDPSFSRPVPILNASLKCYKLKESPESGRNFPSRGLSGVSILLPQALQVRKF